MKKLLLPLAATAILFSGCMNPYVIKLTNGKTLETAHKPVLKNGAYHYDDGQGHDLSVPAGRVQEIEPASMAKEEQDQFSAKPQSTKKRHWYLLWLG